MDLATLLRHCQVLGVRVGSAPVEDWVRWELDGYPEGVDLPEYRLIPMEVRANFSGPYGRILQSAAVPPATIPEPHRKAVEYFRCRESASAIEDLIRPDGDGSLQVPLGNLSIVLGGRVFHGMHCYQAWGLIGRAGLVNVLNSVRNRVLSFSLELWKQEPALGEIAPTAANTAMTSQVFNTVYGGQVHVVSAGRDADVSFSITQGRLRKFAPHSSAEWPHQRRLRGVEGRSRRGASVKTGGVRPSS
jgi:hypothetical protein